MFEHSVYSARTMYDLVLHSLRQDGTCRGDNSILFNLTHLQSLTERFTVFKRDRIEERIHFSRFAGTIGGTFLLQ